MTPIIVVAYNRPKSLDRLLQSLKKAAYPSANITLIISIDASDSNQDVLHLANNFSWEHGDKKVNYQSQNLGLRKHILQCGDYCIEYGSAIILEDDLLVSPNFYSFASDALKFSADKNYIGGISLYNHQINVLTGDYFSAREDGYDNWYLQFASSWGQAWSSNQWSNFKVWYNDEKTIKVHPKAPGNVQKWSEKSWLKFFISFLIEKNKYFLFPKISLSTNFSDQGTHIDHESTKFQVPMLYSKKPHWNFSTLEESKSIYDSYFENEHLYEHLNLLKEEVLINLYGQKPKEKRRYLLTDNILNYKITRTNGKSLKPLEINIIENIEGHDFFLYDTTIVEKNKFKKNNIKNILYNIKGMTYQQAILIAIKLTKDTLKLRLSK